MTEIEQPPQNGIDVTTEDDENNKARPADIEQDMREMERRKRVEAIMGSKLFREELERIVDSAREGGTTGILQQLSDIVGLPSSRLGNVLKASNCMVPINDIRGIESMGYAKGEKILRCKLAATFRLLDLYGWTHGLGSQVTARLKVDQEIFLVNPYGMLYHEITASSLNKVDMQAQVVEQGTTNFGVNKNHFILHSIVHAARPDIRCAIYIGCSPVVAVSALKIGLLPITLDACVLGEITTHSFSGSLIQTEERDKLVRNLGPNSKVILLTNHGALCCGESIEEAFFLACHIVHACETQLKLLPIGVENIVLISEESRKDIYEQARRPPEDLEKKFAAALANIEKTPTTIGEEDNKNDIATKTAASAQKAPNWRVGGAEFEALMRMLDNAGYRTGYIYRHPLVKSELPKPKNDVELPPAVSSLGYLLEEEELYRQGIWKKGDPRKSGDRCRWLNSPNVYQKVEVLETGTPDPKKITKWIAEGSPTHGTPVRIEDALQFVPAGTNTKEFKRVQQQIKDNRRADKISAGPQSQILEGVTWDEANRIKDATVSSAGDHVVLMGAASKGIIQRGFQHNATVYKTPYAKNPFDNVTDDELNEYKRTVERKKKSIHGEYTDTDFSETEALSSVHASAGPTLMKHSVATINHSEPEDVSEHQVMRIETQQAPVPSQPEVILSDDLNQVLQDEISQKYQDHLLDDVAGNKENIFAGNQNINRNKELVADLKKDLLFQRQKEQLVTSPNKSNDGSFSRNLTITTNKSNEPISITNRITKENKKEYHKNTSVLSNPNMTHAINKSLLDRATQYKSNEYCLNFVPYSYSSVATRSNYCSEIALARSKLLNNESIRLTDIKSPNESLESQRLYTKSVFCYTPNVCDSVFESLQRPLENDLILNIPFTIPIQMSTSLASPRKGYSQLDNQTSSPTNCPYRTLSHFGFNSPQSLPKPEHKHIPHELITKYVPLIKSTSYEEIFSSPRYVDLCENCFEKIVRLKPELVYMKTRLRNIVDFNSGNKIDGNEIVKCGSSETTETLPAFPAPLEPVIEESSELVSSDEESICRFKSVEKSISNSTFIDKISRMNYSEESANINFSNTPRTASSNVSLNLEKAEQKHGYIYNNNENLCTDLQHMKLGLEPGDDLSRCDSFTEILDFGNWREHHQTKTDNECVNGDRTLTAKTYDCSSKTSHRSKKRRFMTREERNQRKHEFQELWEDHITFFNNKDETLSDTESAINETAETTPGNATNEPQEIFHGRSMVIKRLFSDPPESVQNFQGHMDACVSLKPLADTKSVDDSDLCYSLNVDESKTHDSHDFIKSANLKKLKLVDSSNYCTPFNPLHKQNSKRELIFRSEPHEGYDDGGFLVNDLAKKNVSESVLDPLYQAGECLLSEKKSQVFSNSTHALVPEADTIDYNKAISPTQLSNLNCDQEKNFNSLERIILEKIEANQLNKSEEIFHKIQSTIRNKLTPSKIDELLQKQKQLLKGDATDTINFELTSSTSSKKSSAKQYSKQSGYSTLSISRLFPENSNHVTYEVETETSTSLTPNTAHYCKKPEKEHQVNLKLPKKQKNYPEFSQAFQVDMINFRRSRSLILCQRTSENKFSYSPLNQVDSTSSEPKSTHSTPEIRRKYGKMDKRNFVLENIRNAAIPQYVKRLQRSITSSVLSENPCSSTISNETKNNNTFPSQIKSDVPETNVYTFQTKLVRGSPRFWVSMSQTPTKKLQGSKHFQIRHKSHLSKLNASSSSISTGTISDFDKSLTSASCSETNVDAELAALSLEIEDVKPHLECYERKLDDYGDHVAECARNMHECVEVQLDIEKEHKKLRNDIFQNHYSEDISCKVQTFSLSETED